MFRNFPGSRQSLRHCPPTSRYSGESHSRHREASAAAVHPPRQPSWQGRQTEPAPVAWLKYPSSHSTQESKLP